MRTLKGEILKASGSAAEKDVELKAREQYCRAIMPLAVHNKLHWHNVAIIQTGDSDELTGTVKKTLETAGANVTSVVDISREFDFSNDSDIANMLASNGLSASADQKANKDKLFRMIADTICTGKYAHLVTALEKAGVATFNGDCNRPCKLVVLVGGTSSDEDKNVQIVDSKLLARFAELGVTAVGCETSSSASSYIPIWHKFGIATVDNADCAMGQTCLIYALNGESANYGTRPTADRLFPKSLENQ